MSTLLSDLKDVEGFWYVATPYSKYAAGIEGAAREAARATAWLMKGGVPCFSPICHTHAIATEGGIDPLDHAFWMPVDEPMMDAAVGLVVVMMDGWQESYGVNVEIEMFMCACKPVHFLDWPGEPT